MGGQGQASEKAGPARCSIWLASVSHAPPRAASRSQSADHRLREPMLSRRIRGVGRQARRTGCRQHQPWRQGERVRFDGQQRNAWWANSIEACKSGRPSRRGCYPVWRRTDLRNQLHTTGQRQALLRPSLQVCLTQLRTETHGYWTVRGNPSLRCGDQE